MCRWVLFEALNNAPEGGTSTHITKTHKLSRVASFIHYVPSVAAAKKVLLGHKAFSGTPLFLTTLRLRPILSSRFKHPTSQRVLPQPQILSRNRRE